MPSRKISKTLAIVLIFEVQCIILLGQTPDSVKQRIKSTSYKIFYEFNQKPLDLPPDYRFYATDGKKNFEAILRNSNTYQFNELPDSFAIFVLEFGTIKIDGCRISIKRILSGKDVTIIFGRFDNVDELKRIWKEERKKDATTRFRRDNNITKSTDLGFPYHSDIIKGKFKHALRRGKIELHNTIFLNDERGVSSCFNSVELQKSKSSPSSQ